MRFIVWLLLFGLCFSAFSQNDTLKFPQDFYGTYKGDLHIINANGKQTIGMEFIMKAGDSIGKHQYTLVYIFNSERQERKYTLIEKDVAKGTYVVDENNGILLDAKLVDNTLYFMFEVQNNIITTTESFYKDAMDFEITFSDTKQKVSSGTEGENAIQVTSYPIGGIQKAHLIKQ